MAPPILLSCESISKAYGAQPLFEELSFALFEGDHVGLVGPNGSGKSTLLKILAGIEAPDLGTRTVRRQLRLGYVPQEPTFAEGRTVEDVLAQVLVAERLDPHEHTGLTARALSIGGFPNGDQPVASLSGGWRKRLAIGRALMMEPDVLLMDEPTNHTGRGRHPLAGTAVEGSGPGVSRGQPRPPVSGVGCVTHGGAESRVPQRHVRSQGKV